MISQTSSAKITRPAAAGIFPRERLFHLLDSMKGQSAVWVSAPAGSGKTTLVASWLESRKIPHLWYLVDQTDTDPASFFYYMGMAVRKSGRSKKPLPLFTGEYAHRLPVFAARYFEDIYRRIKTPRILVFDNCHEVPEGAAFEEITAQAVSLIPEGINFIFISRTGPPPRLVRHVANRDIRSLGWEEIRFSPEETKTFLDIHVKNELPEKMLREIYEKTDGWVAGLVLLHEEIKTSGLAPGSLGSISHERIFDYFAGEVLSKMDGATRDFLLKASFLPRIPADAAGQITGFDAAEKILSALNRRNYFVERRNADIRFYRMHPLFREFLKARAVETYSKEDITALKRSAATLLDAAGQTENAAELWIESKDWASLSALVLKNAERLVNQGRMQTLEGWISKIPEEVLEGSPWLLYWRGMCQMGFDTPGARGLFEKAYRQFTANDDLAGALLCWCSVVDSLFYEWNDFYAFGGLIGRLYALIKKKPGLYFPFNGIEDRINARVAACMASAITSFQPAHPDAEMWAERALALSKDCGDPACRIHALAYSFYFYGSRGEAGKAITVAMEILAVAGSPGIAPVLKVSALLIHARMNVFITPDLEKARADIDDCRELADRTGIRVAETDQLMLGAMAALMAGDFERADRFLHEKIDFRRKIGHCQFLNVLCCREFLAGNLSKAEAHAEAYFKESEKTGFTYPIALSRFQLAHVKHSLGKFEEAQKYIRSFEGLSAGVKTFQFMCQVSRAQFALDMGEEASARGFLEEGFRLGRENNYLVLPWWWDPMAMARLCAKALEAGIEPEYARGLVRKWDLTEYVRPVEAEDWPWPVKIFTLGEFRIERNGRTLEFGGKSQQKPLALLKVMIALGLKDIPEEAVTNILWPDAEGDMAHTSHEVTLVRLRKIIGEKALRVSGGLCTLNEKYCWTDLKAVIRVMERAEGEWKKTGRKDFNEETALYLAEKAIALHKGDFLPAELTAAWAMAAREQVKTRLLKLVTNTGKHLMKKGQWEKAAQKFEQGLGLDNLVEELYQDLMRCEINLGRRAQAARTYERCRRALSETLGLSPSPVTDKIYKSIF